MPPGLGCKWEDHLTVFNMEMRSSLLKILFTIAYTAVAVATTTTTTTSGCAPLPRRTSPPKDVSDLRIDDFSVVMAMGDSMTAGFNAATKADMKEHRGLSFSIGGDPGALTLPNLITSFKPDPDSLVGPALGVLSQPQVKATCSGSDVDRCRLSAAVDGSDLQNLVDLQIPYLNHTLSTASWAQNASVRESWKLLTIFSGLDDVVFFNATDPTKRPTTPELFEHNLEALLQDVYAVFPKTFVNLVMLPELFDPTITTSKLTCKLFKWYSEHAGKLLFRLDSSHTTDGDMLLVRPDC